MSTSSDEIPQPIRGTEGAPDLGPRNLARDRQNPDMLAPPATDHGIMPTLKFSFSDARIRIEEGGWAREVTIRELPVADELAGVDMCLTEGGVREMHWHKEGEWAYMLRGNARITAIDQEGRNFIDDIGAGDMWFFPAGLPHSIQGLAGGCEFLLVFDDGNFSEDETFLLSDWFARTPRAVLAKNFGVAESDLADLPKSERYIFQLDVPPPLEKDAVTSPNGPIPQPFSFHLADAPPMRMAGGQVRIVDSRNFAITTTSCALVEVEPGGMRELHWHPNADEWQYYIEGHAKMTVFGSEKSRTFNYSAADVGYIPFAMGHYIENIGDTTLRYLEMFRHPLFQDVSLNQWMALTPPELVRAHLNLNDRMMAALRKEKTPVVK